MTSKGSLGSINRPSKSPSKKKVFGKLKLIPEKSKGYKEKSIEKKPYQAPILEIEEFGQDALSQENRSKTVQEINVKSISSENL